ncbi:MAG: ABC transporter substrate-binding protein [Anaerolineae bacterium]
MTRRFAGISLFLVLLLVTLAACAPQTSRLNTAGAALPTETHEPTAAKASTEPVVYIWEGDDWGYPSPFAFYARGPGYLQMALVFDTLVWKDADGFIPWLATDWHASADGKTWTFELRDDVRWHDGEPLTAEDVAFTYTYMSERFAEGMITWSWPLNLVASAEVGDDGHTVTIQITEAAPGILNDLFGSLPIIPQHVWEGVSDPLHKLDAEAVIGTGMYMLEDYVKEEGRYAYVANPDFFLGHPIVDELIYAKVSDPALALLAGEIDAAHFTGKAVSSVEELRKSDDLAIIEGPSYWVLKLFMGLERPPLDQVEVRQAIAQAINRQEIVDRAQLGGAIVASTGGLTPDTYWCNPDLPSYPYNPEAARSILASKGAEGTSLTLVTTEPYAREAELIEGYLEAVGLDITIQMGDRTTVDSLLREGNYDLLISGHGGIANPNMTVPSPWTTWDHPEFAAAYAEANAEMDREKRQQEVWEVQTILAEHLPVLPLWHPLMWHVYRKGAVKPFFTEGGIGLGIPLAANKLMYLPESARP